MNIQGKYEQAKAIMLMIQNNLRPARSIRIELIIAEMEYFQTGLNIY
jgi:hypothetical protein